MFYDLMESGEIDVMDCGMMLKACHSAAQMRELIDVTMAKAKLKPDVVTYTTLVGRLRMEGDDAAAESVVEEMKKAGVEPDVPKRFAFPRRQCDSGQCDGTAHCYQVTTRVPVPGQFL